MKDSENKKSKIEKTAEDLLEFAIDREDVKWLLERLPPEADIKHTTVEYELQILKNCGNEEDIFTFMTGSKIFISATTKVGQYLEAIKLR